MAGRQIFNPDGFCNVTEDGKTVGFSFAFKAQYYRGFTLSILRDIAVTVDDETFNREDIRLTVNGETFTLEECRTVIDPDYRWEFGDFYPIPGLYAAGADACNIYDDSYMFLLPGNSMGFAINSGRIAGMSAADYVSGKGLSKEE